MFEMHWSTLVSLICVITRTETFNIDTQYPLIIKNSADGPNSLFGASVVLLNDNNLPGVIIGSPMSNSTLPAHNGINEPGVVWQCSFEKNSDLCRVLVMDPTGNVMDSTGANVTDRKDGGWLGSSIAQNSEYFVTCGSRWVNQFYLEQKSQYFMNGICYWRPKRDVFLDPLPGVSSDSRLLPITRQDKQPGNNWGLGQAGFSAHIPLNRSEELVIGAPGVSAWRGSVMKFSKSPGGQTYGEVLVYQPERNPETLKPNSYFGFALGSGRFFTYDNKPEVQYVSSAPRGNDLTGEVVVFRFPETENDKLEKLQVMKGAQIGSYFGAAICVADLNGDGFDDLLIGAPFYTTDEVLGGTKLGPDIKQSRNVDDRSKFSGDEGAVFVYLNSKGAKLVEQSNFKSVNGDNRPWSHFGTAIANLGDINNDGCADIAIGAPYANDGTGAVYIYYGGENGLSERNRQIIEAKKFDMGLKAFGYSFSEGSDVDRNGYNDLAVGAYDSGHVVILRSKPLVTIHGDVRSILKRLPLDTPPFEIECCLMYTGEYLQDKLDITVKVTSDAMISRTPRVLLRNDTEQSGEYKAIHLYKVKLSKGRESCVKFMAKAEMLETSGKPVVIRQEVSIPESQSQHSTVFDITRFGGQVSTRVSGEGYNKFCKNCPLIDTVKTKLKELQLPLAVLCGADDKCQADLDLQVRFMEISENEPFLIGSFSVLTVDITLTNAVETAISPAVIVSWKSRNLKKFSPECQVHDSNETLPSFKCSLGKIMEAGKSKSVSLEFEMGDLVAGKLDEFWLKVEAVTASDVVDNTTLVKTIAVLLKAEADIFIEASSSTAKFNLETLNPVTSFFHSFDIGLDGTSSIAGAVVEFQIPVRFKHSSTSRIPIKVFEPLVSIASAMSSITCFAISGSFAISKARSTPQQTVGTSMPEWEEEDVEDSTNSEDIDSEKVELKDGGVFTRRSAGELNINCNATALEVECMGVRCRIDTMSPGTRANVLFPINVGSTDIKNIFKRSKFSGVKLTSEGTVKQILGVKTNIQPIKHQVDSAIATSLIDLEIAKPVSYWIYGVGIILGLLILALVVYCMYRVSFFVRKKKPVEPEAVPLKDTKRDQDTTDGDNEGQDASAKEEDRDP